MDDEIVVTEEPLWERRGYQCETHMQVDEAMIHMGLKGRIFYRGHSKDRENFSCTTKWERMDWKDRAVFIERLITRRIPEARLKKHSASFNCGKLDVVFSVPRGWMFSWDKVGPVHEHVRSKDGDGEPAQPEAHS